MFRKGFSLIEMLVVVLVIGILASVGIPSYMNSVEKVRAGEALNILKYMHDRGVECAMKYGKDNPKCWSQKNRDLGIEFPKDYKCLFNGDAEICCNKDWCYSNNLLDYGDECAVGASTTGGALRGRNFTEGSTDEPLYYLEYEDKDYCPHSGIVCYDAPPYNYCSKFFNGHGKLVQ